MVEAVWNTGLMDFEVTHLQFHLILGLFIGYRELAGVREGREELYRTFKSKLLRFAMTWAGMTTQRDVCVKWLSGCMMYCQRCVELV